MTTEDRKFLEDCGCVIDNIEVAECVMSKHMGTDAMLEQLAENAVELARHALEVAKIIRNDNPKHREKVDALEDMFNAYTDLRQCANEIGLFINTQRIKDNEEDFKKRLTKESTKGIKDNKDSNKQSKKTSKAVVKTGKTRKVAIHLKGRHSYT